MEAVIRILWGILFWTLAAIELAALLFMLFFSLAAGPSMAENGDMVTPIVLNILLPLAALIAAIILFARSSIPALRALALLIVVVPVVWLLAAPEGETIRTSFENSAATAETN